MATTQPLLTDEDYAFLMQSGTDQQTLAQAMALQQKQADRLRKQDVQEGQMISGHYIPPSILGELANVRNQYTANKREQEALQSGKAAAAAQQKQNETLFGALRRSNTPATPEAYDY